MDYEVLRQKHVAFVASILPDQVERLRWPADRIKQEREERLRDLLRVAKDRSPWHRERLQGINADTFVEADLPNIEPMNKDDLMSNWDDIVTDPRLSLDLANRHIAETATDAYLFDEFHIVASGGSTGRRGVFAYGWEPWALAYAAFPRAHLWDRAVSPDLAGLPSKVAFVAADLASHMTSSMAQTFSNPEIEIARFPVTLPVDQIVAGLNDFQPVMLMGYPSGLAPLAEEAQTGRLRIQPKRLATSSEPLLPQVRKSLEEAFAAPLANLWGTSEGGPVGTGCWRGPGMHLADDLLIVEPVDDDGRPVPNGTQSAKIFVTTIANPTLPLVRFEITDQITFLDERCPCGSSHQLIADIEGRLDDAFTYAGGVTVNAHIFRSALLKDSTIIEYQVHQTEAGAEISVVGSADNSTDVAHAIEKELARLGVANPTVHIRVVDGFERQTTGKVRRFVPLDRANVSTLVAAGGLEPPTTRL
jgi:phenylacetate-CoA ligase